MEDLEPGTLLGGTYRVVRVVGRGAVGTVYEALQEGLGRRVAVKVLHAARDRVAVERFRREALAAAALAHPSIVAVSDFRIAQGEPPYIVMELLEGASLGALVAQRGPLSPERACSIAVQILAALGVAHERGIVHRDVKPDNVFVTSNSAANDVVKLLDFGVAKLDVGGAPLTRAGEALGAFVAPEPGGARGPAADLYATGATLAFALTGAADGPLDSVDPALAAVVRRATSPDPSARFEDARAMQLALAPWAGARTEGSVQPAPIAVGPTAETVVVARARRSPPKRRLALPIALASIGVVSAASMAWCAARTGMPAAPTSTSTSTSSSPLATVAPVASSLAVTAASEAAVASTVPTTPARPVVRDASALSPLDPSVGPQLDASLASDAARATLDGSFPRGLRVELDREASKAALLEYNDVYIVERVYQHRSHILFCFDFPHQPQHSMRLRLEVQASGYVRSSSPSDPTFDNCIGNAMGTLHLPEPHVVKPPIVLELDLTPLY